MGETRGPSRSIRASHGPRPIFVPVVEDGCDQAEVLRIDPNLTLEKRKRQLAALGFDPDVIGHIIDGLRKAGLPVLGQCAA